MAFGRYQPANVPQSSVHPSTVEEAAGVQEDYLSLDEPSAGFHLGDVIWVLAIAAATAAVLAVVYAYF